jgi:hemerythrin-like metal-binding protein
MDYFEWNDALKVGNQLIDQDHFELVTLVNELHQAVQEGKSTDVLAKILQALLNYTQEHFQREELLMEHIAYADIEAHKAMHQKLLDQVLVLQDAFERGRSEVASNTAELLRYWLTHHIMRTDKNLSHAIREAGLLEL